jgi:L-fucose mutarotase
MLKNIDPLLSGELLRHLDELGHGDALVLADRNYPAYAAGLPVIRVDAGIVRTAEAILSVLPLDFAVPPVAKMEAYDDPAHLVPNAVRVLELASAAEGRELELENIPRFDFYERAKLARLVVLTREDEPYNDFVFVKGVIPQGS